ncbi:MAG: SCO family protein [Gammaproteobacteria bacterium]
MLHKPFVALIAGVIALGAAAWFGLHWLRPAPSPAIAGIYLPEARPIGTFALLDQSGKPFTPDRFKNHWSFVFFGYTNCPAACPLVMGQLNVVDKKLGEQGLNQDNAYVLVSVDPRRDTPKRLGEFLAPINPKFIGVTGTAQELDKLARQVGIAYDVPANPEDPENYMVDHSLVVLLIDPSAQLRAIFTPPHDPAKLIADFAAIRARQGAIN